MIPHFIRASCRRMQFRRMWVNMEMGLRDKPWKDFWYQHWSTLKLHLLHRHLSALWNHSCPARKFFSLCWLNLSLSLLPPSVSFSSEEPLHHLSVLLHHFAQSLLLDHLSLCCVRKQRISLRKSALKSLQTESNAQQIYSNLLSININKCKNLKCIFNIFVLPNKIYF